jgi:hypothetical protein
VTSETLNAVVVPALQSRFTVYIRDGIKLSCVGATGTFPEFLTEIGAASYEAEFIGFAADELIWPPGTKFMVSRDAITHLVLTSAPE